MQKKTKKQIKIQDLKPKKDAKGGMRVQSPGGVNNPGQGVTGPGGVQAPTGNN